MCSRELGVNNLTALSISWNLKLVKLLAFATVLLVGASPAAEANTIPYRLTDFSLSNTDADGTWATPDSGLTLVFTGGNSGFGLAGTTDFWLVASSAVSFQFDYSYFSIDIPGFDRAGYFVGPKFFVLADTDGRSGTATVSVNTGDPFGFRIETDDNTGEPGVFTVSTFTTSAAPEPGAFYLIPSAILVGLGVARFRYRGPRQKENK